MRGVGFNFVRRPPTFIRGFDLGPVLGESPAAVSLTALLRSAQQITAKDWGEQSKGRSRKGSAQPRALPRRLGAGFRRAVARSEAHTSPIEQTTN